MQGRRERGAGAREGGRDAWCCRAVRTLRMCGTEKCPCEFATEGGKWWLMKGTCGGMLLRHIEGTSG